MSPSSYAKETGISDSSYNGGQAFRLFDVEGKDDQAKGQEDRSDHGDRASSSRRCCFEFDGLIKFVMSMDVLTSTFRLSHRRNFRTGLGVNLEILQSRRGST